MLFSRKKNGPFHFGMARFKGAEFLFRNFFQYGFGAGGHTAR